MSSTLYFCHILIKFEIFSTDFSKKIFRIFMKIRHVETELIHAEGQTEVTMLNSSFCNNFAKVAKKN